MIGWPLAFGEGNFFLGYNQWAVKGVSDSGLATWFFHFVFAATATTIVSGALAERCEFTAYLIYSFVITGKFRKLLIMKYIYTHTIYNCVFDLELLAILKHSLRSY